MDVFYPHQKTIITLIGNNVSSSLQCCLPTLFLFLVNYLTAPFNNMRTLNKIQSSTDKYVFRYRQSNVRRAPSSYRLLPSARLSKQVYLRATSLLAVLFSVTLVK